MATNADTELLPGARELADRLLTLELEPGRRVFSNIHAVPPRPVSSGGNIVKPQAHLSEHRVVVEFFAVGRGQKIFAAVGPGVDAARALRMVQDLLPHGASAPQTNEAPMDIPTPPTAVSDGKLKAAMVFFTAHPELVALMRDQDLFFQADAHFRTLDEAGITADVDANRRVAFTVTPADPPGT